MESVGLAAKAETAVVSCRFTKKTWTESLTELLCCVVYSLSQSSLSGETTQYNGYLFFNDFLLIKSNLYKRQFLWILKLKVKSIKFSDLLWHT